MAKKKRKEDEKAGEGWIISYADLMTLLFATFVVLYGLKPEGEAKNLVGVTSSIRESFVEIPDEIPPDERKGPIKKGKSVFRYFKGDMIKPPLLKQYRRASNVMNLIDEDFQQFKNILEIMSKKTKTKSPVPLKQQGMTLHKEKDGFRLRLVASHFFAPGASTMDEKYMWKFQQIAKLLRELDRKIVIEGHTDNTQSKGKFNNLELSSMRASFAANYLTDKLDFPKTKVSIAGYGDSRPIATNDTEEGRKLNRRIEIKVIYD